jgi:hypothetical protein
MRWYVTVDCRRRPIALNPISVGYIFSTRRADPAADEIQPGITKTNAHSPTETMMSDTKRRDFLKATAGVAAGSALGAGSALWTPEAMAQTYRSHPRGRDAARAAGSAAGRRGRVGRQHRRNSPR